MFSKVILAAITLAAAHSALATPTPQLGGLSIVCLTGVLSSTIDSLPLIGSLSIIDCASGETCQELDIPIIGSLLPIGVSARFNLYRHMTHRSPVDLRALNIL